MKPIPSHQTAPQIVLRRPDALRSAPRNARTHSRRQIKEIADSISRFGFTNPILVDEAGTVLAGHGRLEAARLLGLDEVPTLCLSHLSPAKKRAYLLADNRLAERAGWDRELLRIEFDELSTLLEAEGLDLTVTGFETLEIDEILADLEPLADDVPVQNAGPSVTRRGDIWSLGRHRLSCGDAQDSEVVSALMAGELATMIFADPPYNVRINGHVQSRGRVRHEEFAFASGEMSREDFTAFLERSLRPSAAHLRDGAIAFICMDWRHIGELLSAGERVFDELKNLCVWTKTSPGQGTFYRSQHELIFVFKKGTDAHVNNFGLGKGGRTRSNVWSYPGANTFRAGRLDDLALHPTPKPVALVADAMRDCSARGDLILDPFLGSGTTIMAAEMVGRRAYGIEINPAYVDSAIRRWSSSTRKDALLAETGETFDQVAARRLGAEERQPAASEASPETSDQPDWVALCGGQS